MIAHLFRLAWNRRRTHALLVAELLLSFLVLAPMIAGWVLFAVEESKPLGFHYEDVWHARLSARDGSLAGGEDRRNVELAMQELRALDQVEGVAVTSQAPLRFPAHWSRIYATRISDEGLDVLGLGLVSGRWFAPEDEALDWTPAVIDQELSRALFGDEDPLGQALGDSPMMDLQGGYSPSDPHSVRVVGVVENCFYYKEHNTDVPGFLFLRFSDEWLADPGQSWTSLLVKTSAGSGPAAGERIRSRIQAVVPADQAWSLEVESLAERNADDRLDRLSSLWFLALLSGLMMLMVALGLIGVMWQNVRRRTREIGIRRAVGAPAGRIYGQFLGEPAVLVTAAIVLGCVPLFQLGLLEMVLWSRVPGPVAAAGAGATALVLYLAVLVCGLYPSWLAARVRPAEALHHD